MKKAILVVSFGTIHHDTRKKNIEACEEKIKEGLEDYDFYRAFTSQVIISKVKIMDNIFIDNPKEALEKLYYKGYKEIIVQSLHITCGCEYNKLRNIVLEFKDKFEKIYLGRPLLTYKEDYIDVVLAIKKDLERMKSNEFILFMGHGSENKSNIVYNELEYVFRKYNINAFIATINGYPSLKEVIKKLKDENIKTINLIPLLLVVGNHVLSDMIGTKENSWKAILEKEGFNVNVHLKGLGENIYIQEIFKRHALESIK